MFVTPKREFIKILDIELDIIIDTKKCEDECADGLYEHETIYLKSVYENYEHYNRVLFHECFHGLCEALGCQLDHHMEETLAHTVSKMHIRFHD